MFAIQLVIICLVRSEWLRTEISISVRLKRGGTQMTVGWHYGGSLIRPVMCIPLRIRNHIK